MVQNGHLSKQQDVLGLDLAPPPMALSESPQRTTKPHDVLKKPLAKSADWVRLFDAPQ
jgi:hypothetical protein